ncbi:MAG: hypothetical protein JKY67_03440 [Pseudomonadales bacterium]|nr:hypothetical protein [Pseudomonadales bacterium]
MIFKLLLVFNVFLFSPPIIGEERDSSKQFHRLFTTTGDRILLDRVRREGLSEDFEMNSKTATVKEVRPRRRELYLQGVMLRDDGNHVVWVNGQNTMSSRELEEGIIVDLRHILKDGPAIPVETLTSEFTIKPGQVWLEDLDKVIEAYGHLSPNEGDTSELRTEDEQGESDSTEIPASASGETTSEGDSTGLGGVANIFNKKKRQNEIDDILSQGG